MWWNKNDDEIREKTDRAIKLLNKVNYYKNFINEKIMPNVDANSLVDEWKWKEENWQDKYFEKDFYIDDPLDNDSISSNWWTHFYMNKKDDKMIKIYYKFKLYNWGEEQFISIHIIEYDEIDIIK